MARNYFGIEKGIHLLTENEDTGVKILFGSGAPSLDSEIGSKFLSTDGLTYTKKLSGSGLDKWVRDTNTDDLLAIKFRSEKVVAGTAVVAPVSGSSVNLVTNPFSDDEGTKLTAQDFSVGDHLIYGIGGTPKLMKISELKFEVITGTNDKIDFNEGGSELTATLASGTYIHGGSAVVGSIGAEIKAKMDAAGTGVVTVTNAIQPDGTYKYTIASTAGTFSILLGTGTNTATAFLKLNGGFGSSDLTGSTSYTAANSATPQKINVVDPDDAMTAQDKFVVQNYLPDSPNDQEKQAIVEYTGTSIIKLGDLNWNFADGIGLAASYTPASGNVTSADTVNSAIQKLDGNIDALNTLTGMPQGATDLDTFTGTIIPDDSTIKGALQALETSIQNFDNESALNGVTTEQVLDEVLVDDVKAVVWDVWASLDSAPARVKLETVSAIHDGTAVTDAVNVDDAVYAKLKIGAAFNKVVVVKLNGLTGAAQKMQLAVSASAAVSFRAIRRDVY